MSMVVYPLLHSLPGHQWLSCNSYRPCMKCSSIYTYFKLHLPMHITPLRALAHCWLPRSQILAQDVTFQISNIIHRKFLCCEGVAIVSELSVVLLAERVKAEFDRHWCSQSAHKVSRFCFKVFDTVHKLLSQCQPHQQL